ncbi:hypothetical protein CUP0442 [Campylobacter upsaliensis RM3195]|nr:hypothetical protein CUP0442 [Campylobacter upsaliensis RM3195]
MQNFVRERKIAPQNDYGKKYKCLHTFLGQNKALILKIKAQILEK